MKYVAGLMFSPDGHQLAMVLKDRPKWQAGLFNAIGGKIESGEEPIQAMVREFKEETGVDTSVSDWQFFTRIEGEDFEVSFFTMFSDKVQDVKTQETETIHLINPYQLPMNIIFNMRWLIPAALEQQAVFPRLIKYRK
jgi:8-oxo-dGTP diphosphatase